MCPQADEPVEIAAVRPRRVKKGKVTVVGVLGELLITVGALVLLFLGWQLWWNDMLMASSQSSAASEISQDWIDQDTAAPKPVPTVDPVEPSAVPVAVDYGSPVVAAAPSNATAFAVLYVPRFGAEYHRSIAEGTGHDVLNSNRLGIGHYAGTQMPGEIGNFAVAAHRSAFGGAMHLINELQLGDAIYVQTADGYYTYRYRDTEYVAPSQVQVLASVPNNPDNTAVDRIITLTSCNPLYSTAERIIAYGVLESWQPLSAGAPAELAPIIAAQG
ncbi:class E sortase [Cryobacterium sp. TMT1-3]|uniref:Class E sortase n=1 Tax=Cryobacterium luteum TaxID=1424661 RepID=A0A1H8HXW7_9MICO|nr:MULTISPECIES: class E sortase [Cryobacterium]TFB94229.1 class E sortase [Cryobacterium luteum]TFC26813.1 class E sortase [Cryobacterium sp. TMT1-3]SEN61053.1 sortase A [Cryobacterium luteum]